MEPIALHHGLAVGVGMPQSPHQLAVYNGGGLQDGQEVVRRQAEWEREIDALDQKEMELHQSQLRLIREQTATFVQDLAVLQGDVDRFKHFMERLRQFPERLEYLEKVLGNSAERHTRELQAAHNRLDELHGRLAEAHGSAGERETSLHRRVERLEQLLEETSRIQQQDSQAVRAAHAQLHGDLTRVHEERHASLAERVSFLEKKLGDSADKHARELQVAHAKVDEMHLRLNEQHGGLKERHGSLESRMQAVERFVKEAVDRHARELDDSRASQLKLHQDAKVREAQHGTVEQRLRELEAMCGTGMSKHAKALDLAGNRLDQLHNRLNEHHNQLVSHGTLQERVSSVEKALHDNQVKHDEERADLAARLEQIRGRLSACEAGMGAFDAMKKSHQDLVSSKAKHDANHESVAQRMEYLEEVMQKLGDQTHREGAESKTKLDQLAKRVSECERQASMISDLQKAHAGLANDKATAETYRATLRERVDYLEIAVGSSAEKHFKELEALKTAHSRLAAESKTREAHHSSIQERVAFIEQQLGESADKHAKELSAAHAKLEHLHGRLSVCEAHGVAIDGLKKSHATLAQDKASRESHHRSVGERLDYLERMVGDSAEKHARELANAHSKLDQVHNRLSACERQSSAIGDLQQAHADMAQGKSTLDLQHEAVRSQMEDLHRAVVAHGDKHTKELEAMKAAHARILNEHKARDSHHATVAARLEQVEASLADHAERHVREITATHTKCDHLQARLSEDRAAHEAHVRGLLANEKDMRDSHHATLKERIDYIEHLLGESAEKHRQDMENLKGAHSKHAMEAKARQTDHATLSERVETMERFLGDAHGRYSQDITAAHTALDKAMSRLASFEKQMQQLEDFRKACAGVTNDRAAALDRGHAVLQQKVEYLESIMGDSFEQHKGHSKDVETMRATHNRLLGELRQQDARHETVDERLRRVEQLLEASAEKQAQELNTHAGRVEDLHGRLARCEAYGTAIDALKKAHGSLMSEQAKRSEHHAGVSERLDFLERVIGDSVDKHAKEMRSTRERLEQLQGHVAQDQAAREAHLKSMQGLLIKDRDGEVTNATVQKRLECVESLLNASADRFERLSQKVNAMSQMMEQHTHHISEHLGNEKQAREAHERDMRSQIAREQKAREVHEQAVADRFGHEKAARERHHSLLQDLIAHERDERAKHHGQFQEELQRRSALHDNRHKELHDLLMKERAAREQHISTYSADKLQSREASAVGKSVEDRVEALQRTVGMLDGLVRKELDERARENRRIWDAIDNHTHDLSTQVITESLPAGSEPMPMLSSTGGMLAEPPTTVHRYAQSPLPASAVPTAVPAPLGTFAWRGSPPRQAVAGAMMMEPAMPTVSPVPVPGPLPFRPPLSPTPSTTALAPPLAALPAPSVGVPTMAVAFSTTPVAMLRPVSPRPGSPRHVAERVVAGPARFGGERPPHAAALLME
mmetsp:Transcript_51792/g.150580  ORF Transcript_51792/g.150580 Transcript_51792/m.150580 type:complete len:1459 (-) Transcript_51792:92-4468(-)